MAAGKTVEKASILTTRISADEGLAVDGDAPARHVFSARWLERMIEAGHVTVTIELGDGHAYTLSGFELRDQGDSESGPNFSAWVADLSSKPKRKGA